MKTDHGIPDNQLYLVVTAMRGPDRPEVDYTGQPLFLLKAVLTTRLRSILFTEADCQGLYNNEPFRRGDLKFVESALTSCRKEDDHFLYHLLEAVEVTQSHPIWNGFAREIVAKLILWRAQV